MLKNIVDGWLLNPTILYLPYRTVPMMLGQLEPLRRAHNMREYIWLMPEDLTVAIPARGQLNQQIRVPPNSYLWGGTFYKFVDGEAGPFVPAAPTDLSLQFTDDATGCQYGSEFIAGTSLYPGGSKSTPGLLMQPRLFIAPGLVSVEIANLADEDVFCQLALYFSEPCDKTVEGRQCP